MSRTLEGQYIPSYEELNRNQKELGGRVGKITFKTKEEIIAAGLGVSAVKVVGLILKGAGLTVGATLAFKSIPFLIAGYAIYKTIDLVKKGSRWWDDVKQHESDIRMADHIDALGTFGGFRRVN